MDIQIKRESIVSSNIESVGYDRESETLEIEFKSGGVYRYSNVPHTAYTNLVMAESVGKYFHQHIKGEYEYEKVEDE